MNQMITIKDIDSSYIEELEEQTLRDITAAGDDSSLAEDIGYWTGYVVGKVTKWYDCTF